MVNESKSQNLGIGIDLGTSNSAVCRVHLDKGKPAFDYAGDLSGGREIVSAIYVDSNGRLYHGRGASRRQADGNEEERVLSNLKLQLRGNEPYVFDGVSHYPVDLMRDFLAFLKNCYEAKLSDGRPLRRAVITVPAGQGFDVDYRANLEAAIAGPRHEPLFDDWEMLEEPDAALLSLVNLRPLDGQRVLVFDMGGGTLDVTVRQVTAPTGKQPILQPCGLQGGSAAGSSLTNALTDLAIDRWAANTGRTFTDEQRADIRRRNFWRSDETKLLLSAAAVQDEDIWSSRPYDIHLSYMGVVHTVEMTVADLTRLSQPLADAAQAIVLEALTSAALTPREVDSYFMVGGSSQLPLVQQMMRDLLGKDPSPVMGSYGKMDVNLAVARGAALFGMQGYKTQVPTPRISEGAESLQNVVASSQAPTAPTGSAEPAAREHSYILPVLERRLAYDISVRGLKGDGEIAEVIVPKGSILPSAPITRTFYMQHSGTHMDFHFMRGSGDPRLCTPLHQRELKFDEVRGEGEPVTVTITVSGDGRFSITTDDEGLLVAATLTGASA
jgi:molecular chaperone DnaK (HSP70)